MIAVAVLPLFNSVIARNFAWVTLLQDKGAVNYVLDAVGLPQFQMMYTTQAVLIAECQILLPFMILAIYSAMENIDLDLLRAARSLGASRFSAFVRVFLPLTRSGVVAGCVIVFVQSFGFYLTPAMLGSTKNTLIPQVIVTQVNVVLDWGKGGTLALVILVSILAILAVGGILGGRARTGPGLPGLSLGRSRR